MARTSMQSRDNRSDEEAASEDIGHRKTSGE
jgi:hypothetical protein